MINISAALRRAGTHRRDRDTKPSEELVSRIHGSTLGGTLSWDGPDEEWATIGFADPNAIHVYMLAPIVLVTQPRENAVRLVAGPDDEVIVVSDLDASELCADPGALVAAFGQHVAEGQLQVDAFAASDLWFWTI